MCQDQTVGLGFASRSLERGQGLAAVLANRQLWDVLQEVGCPSGRSSSWKVLFPEMLLRLLCSGKVSHARAVVLLGLAKDSRWFLQG